MSIYICILITYWLLYSRYVNANFTVMYSVPVLNNSVM